MVGDAAQGTATRIDIAGEGARRRAAAVLLEYGVRVQWSAFELDLDGDEVERLRARLAAILDPATDRLALYPIDRSGQRRVVWLGAGPIESLPEHKPPYFLA
jgi:CRISPR-associated protein Cas2